MNVHVKYENKQKYGKHVHLERMSQLQLKSRLHITP